MFFRWADLVRATYQCTNGNPDQPIISCHHTCYYSSSSFNFNHCIAGRMCSHSIFLVYFKHCRFWVLYHLTENTNRNPRLNKTMIWCHIYFITVSSRFKTFKNYLYQYTTESRNAMGGTINGVQMSCQVVYCRCLVYCVSTVWVYLIFKLSPFFCADMSYDSSLGRDWSSSAMQFHHENQGLFAQWDIIRHTWEKTRICEVVQLWWLLHCYEQVSS